MKTTSALFLTVLSLVVSPPAMAGSNQLFYYQWEGTSPGVGFTYTQLTAIFLDIESSKFKGLSRVARAPGVLPHQEKQIAKMLESIPWTNLSKEDHTGLLKLIEAWRSTHPPAVYHRSMALGREDGFVEMLRLSSNGRTISTRVNPRVGHNPSDPNRPPDEWNRLIEKLQQLTRESIPPSKTAMP